MSLNSREAALRRAAVSPPEDRWEWDYSSLARHYDARPGYAEQLVNDVLARIGISAESRVLDVGAGTGALTVHLCARSGQVWACEPNAAMRELGQRRAGCETARWINARGESLPVSDGCMDLITFGSSFNVIAADAAVAESRRVLHADGHWLALWNHRDLSDPLQQTVERCIRRWVPNYQPGRRREDPRPDLAHLGGFAPAEAAEQRVVRQVDGADWLYAWRAHATLRQQAGEHFERLLLDIAAEINGEPTLSVPYITRVFWARRA